MRAGGVPLWTLETFAPVGRLRPVGLHPAARALLHQRPRDARPGRRAAARRRAGRRRTPSSSAAAPRSPTRGRWRRSSTRSSSARSKDHLDAIVAALSGRSRGSACGRSRPYPACGCPGAAPGRPERQIFTGFSDSDRCCGRSCPVLEAVHDRVVVEVMRGCTAGCRFCQAGMWYRPVRERPVDLVVAAADRLLDETGCDEVSLLSLSSCDYGGVAEALTRIRELRPGLRVSLPSLRIDSAAESLAGFAADQRGSRHAGARGRHPGAARRHQQGRRRGAVRRGRARPRSRAGSPASSCTS